VPGRPPGPRRSAQLAGLAVSAVLLLAVIGFAADQVIAGAASAQRPAAAPSAARPATARATAASSRARPSARPSSTASPVTAAPTVGANPVRTPPVKATPATAPPVSVKPVSATPFGAGGPSDGDNPQDASLALSASAGSGWHTDWYSSATFGGLKTGTGLLFDLGRTVTLTGATIGLGRTPGADFQLRAGTTTADLATAASVSGAGTLVRLRLSAPVRARYLLIWFTRLPPNGNGTFEAFVSSVTATVTPS
jgi:hypothetical protein